MHQGSDVILSNSHSEVSEVIRHFAPTIMSVTWAAERSDYTMVWEGTALFTHNGCPPPPNSIVNLNVSAAHGL